MEGGGERRDRDNKLYIRVHISIHSTVKRRPNSVQITGIRKKYQCCIFSGFACSDQRKGDNKAKL